MLTDFVDREKHLDFLNKRYDSKGFDLVLIYGRRRIGKTELIKEFIKDKPHIYCLSSLEDKEKQLENITNIIHEQFGGFKPEIKSWSTLFEYYESNAQDGLILVIDEFPYLMEENKAMPSLFQKFVDEYLNERNLMLILCGSSISMMEDLMSYKNPLYGRRSGQIDLKPFNFQNARKMLPKTDFEDQIRYYSVFGGVPFYLKNITKATLKENIIEKICRDVEILYEEPTILLKQEFRKPNRYFSIMESIASGKTTPKIISDDTKIPQQSVPKYLGELEKIRLIDHEKPVTERNKRSRKGIYKISDNYFDFWFQFMAPHLSDVERGPEAFVDDHIMPNLDAYVGKKFEDVCIEYMWSNEDFNFSKIGRWWWKEEEIDIVALNEKERQIYLGECKWSEKVNTKTLYHDLIEKGEKVRWRNEDRKVKYVLFAKSFKENFSKEDLTCIDLNQMGKSMK